MRKKLRSFVLREPVRTPVEISRSSTDDLRDEESDLSDLLKINHKIIQEKIRICHIKTEWSS